MPASKIDRSYFRLLAAQHSYRRREAAMLEWLAERMGTDCYVSWSAGKDSMVVASAARRIRNDIPILMVDPGVPTHWTAEDRVTMLERMPGTVLFPFDKFARHEVATAGTDSEYRQAVHTSMFADLETYARERGLTRRITGMRAAESRNRRVLLASTRGETKRTLQPIWQWSTEDVWTYIVAHDLPWLSIYDYLGPSARNGLIGKNGMQHGRLVYLKRFYPEAFAHACEVFGEAREYA